MFDRKSSKKKKVILPECQLFDDLDQFDAGSV